jgi:hypothetical protein
MISSSVLVLPGKKDAAVGELSVIAVIAGDNVAGTAIAIARKVKVFMMI